MRRVIAAMRKRVAAGVTTAELDDVGARVMREQAARSAPTFVYGFPGSNPASKRNRAVVPRYASDRLLRNDADSGVR